MKKKLKITAESLRKKTYPRKQKTASYPVNVFRDDAAWLDEVRDREGYKSKAVVIKKMKKVIEVHQLEEEI